MIEQMNFAGLREVNGTTWEIARCIFAPVEDGWMSWSDMIDCFGSDDSDEICARPYEEIERKYLEWFAQKRESN